MKKKKISIIGHFGGKNELTNGQTVKTMNLYKELLNKTNWKIFKVDTYYAKKNPALLMLQTIWALITSKDIIVLLSGNGMKIYFPLLYYSAILFNKRIYHDVIGGNLASHYLVKYPKYKKYLSGFKINWVETRLLKNEVKSQGIENVEVVPNFRRFKTISEGELQSEYEEPFSFCTFSRVIKEKGIEDAIEAVLSINEKEKKTVCKLDIYGPIEDNYKNRFLELMSQSPDSIVYKGEVKTEEAINVLKNYYGLLFPTFWNGESQAGTVSESMMAGIPVLATDWRCNCEMVTSGYNGMLYPNEKISDLKQAIYWLIEQRNEIIQIKKNCLESAQYYQPDQHIQYIIDYINDNED